MSGKHEKIQAYLQSLSVSDQDGDPGYLAYFQCFNTGLYYEAHDVLEDLWLKHRHGPRYAFHKGLIQLAGAFVHLQKGRLKPASALFRLCLKYLTPYAPIFQGLNLTTTISMAKAWDHFLHQNKFLINPLHTLPPPNLNLEHPLSTTARATRSQARLIVFCKAPRAGLVKTRIATTQGAEQACYIYQELLLRTLDACSPFSNVTLQFAPDDAEARQELAPWLFHPRWQLHPQSGTHLGDRLHHAIDTHLSHNPDGVVVIGSDCPQIQPSDLAEAWMRLGSEDTDLVLGPASDGGYWLVGLKRSCATLFEGIDWSTEKVLAQTLERAEKAGLRSHKLRTLEDVDTVDAWRRWQMERENRSGNLK